MRTVLAVVVLAAVLASAAASDSEEKETCNQGILEIFSPRGVDDATETTCVACGAALYYGEPDVYDNKDVEELGEELKEFCEPPNQRSHILCAPNFLKRKKGAWGRETVEAGSEIWQDTSHMQTLRSEFLKILEKNILKIESDSSAESAKAYFEESWDEEGTLKNIVFSCTTCSACCPEKTGGSLALRSSAFYSHKGYDAFVRKMPRVVKDSLDEICLDTSIGRRAQQTSKEEQRALEEAKERRKEAERAKIEAEQRRQEEEEKKQRLEEERKRLEEEERVRRDEEKRLRQEEEERKKQADEKERKRLEADQKRRAAEEELRQREHERQKAEIAERQRRLEEERRRKVEEEKRERLRIGGIELPGETEEEKTLDNMPPNQPVGVPKNDPVMNLVKIPVGRTYVLVLRPIRGKSSVLFDPLRGDDMDAASNIMSRTFRRHNSLYLERVMNALTGMMSAADNDLQCFAVGHTAAQRSDAVTSMVSTRRSWCENDRLRNAIDAQNTKVLSRLSSMRAQNVAAYIYQNSRIRVGSLGLGASYPSKDAFDVRSTFPQSQGDLSRRVEIVCGKTATITQDVVRRASDVCESA